MDFHSQFCFPASGMKHWAAGNHVMCLALDWEKFQASLCQLVM